MTASGDDRLSTPLLRAYPGRGPAGPARRTGVPSRATRAARWLAARPGRRGYRVFRVRLAVQAFFAALCAASGWRFARFVHAAQAGADALPARPAGVEGFLPISGLMGALDWLYRGTLNTIHPAATVLLLLFLAVAVLFRKAFCSWICPVGFLSDALSRLGRRLFRRNFRPWRWVDLPLRGLKHVLLGFFVWVIVRMDPVELRAFLESPYNRMADVKMYLFFARASVTTLVVLGVLAVVSVFIQGAWCRYLCPYGALLGFFSWFSPVRIRRNERSCTDCGLCDRACPAWLPVSRSRSVSDALCTGCLDCIASCPVRDTLTIGTARRRVPVVTFAALLLAFFVAGYGAARMTGHWDNHLSAAEYRDSIRHVDSFGHPGM